MKSIPLKYVASINAGQSPPSSEVYDMKEGLPFLQGNAEFGERNPEPRFQCPTAPKVALPGDVLLSVRAPVGALNISNRTIGIGRGLNAITAVNCHPGFLWWWLHSQRDYLDAASVGTTYRAVTAEDVGRLRFPVIDMEEQRRIADFLDAETSRIDRVSQLAERQRELLIVRRRAYIDSILGGDDKDSERVPLRYVLRPSYVAGGTGLQVLSVYRDFGVVPKNSRTDNYNKTPDDLSRYLIVGPGDVVVNKMKAWQGSVGVSEYSGIVSPDYLVASVQMAGVYSKFLHYLLRSPRLIAEYAVRSKGIRPSQWRLYWEDLASIPVSLPSYSKQQDSVLVLEREDNWVETMLVKMRGRQELLAERRQALITAAVTGQFDVSTASGRNTTQGV